MKDRPTESRKTTGKLTALKRFLQEKPQPVAESDVPNEDPYLSLREVDIRGAFGGQL
jgi:hypothetical protein